MTLSLIVDYVTPSLWDTLPLDIQRIIIGFKQTMEAKDKYDKVVRDIVRVTTRICTFVNYPQDMAVGYGYIKLERYADWIVRITGAILKHQCGYYCKCNGYILKIDGSYRSKRHR